MVPVPSEAPLFEAAYQLIVPAEAVAPRLAVPAPQRVTGVVPVIVGIVFTVAITADLEVVVHPLAVAAA